MNNKFVYLIPKGGFNDCLNIIDITLNYCKKYQRILLLDMTNSCYKINFSDYFTIKLSNIIYDINEIKKILLNNNYTIYPTILSNELNNILNKKINLKYQKDGYLYENYKLNLPKKDILENIIIYSCCGYGKSGYNIFKHLEFKNNIKELCEKKYSLLNNSKYLYIQVRNTDYKSDFKKLYINNKKLIHSYNVIYLATDDKKVLNFFKNKKLNIYTFNVYPLKKYKSLHTSNISSDDKIKCLIYDIYFCIKSDKILSNSKGGFIKLLRDCYNNKIL